MVAAADILREISSEPERPEGGAIHGGGEAVEELLEIQLAGAVPAELGRSVSMAMRTPGDDAALALGFLHAEGILRRHEDVESVQHCGPPVRDDGSSNVIKVQLRRSAAIDLRRLDRGSASFSSLGTGASTSLEAVRNNDPPAIGRGPIVVSSIVHTMPRRLRRHPAVVDLLGTMSVAALFQPDGRLLRVREDASRHNAVDKVIGAEFMAGSLPRPNEILFVSTRASFEIVRKALMAAIPVVVSVGAPSSLAITLAREHAMTLLGFVRDGQFQVYSGAARVLDDSPAAARVAPAPAPLQKALLQIAHAGRVLSSADVRSLLARGHDL